MQDWRGLPSTRTTPPFPCGILVSGLSGIRSGATVLTSLWRVPSPPRGKRTLAPLPRFPSCSVGFAGFPCPLLASCSKGQSRLKCPGSPHLKQPVGFLSPDCGCLPGEGVLSLSPLTSSDIPFRRSLTCSFSSFHSSSGGPPSGPTFLTSLRGLDDLVWRECWKYCIRSTACSTVLGWPSRAYSPASRSSAP